MMGRTLIAILFWSPVIAAAQAPAKPYTPAKTAWGNARDSAVGFGHTVTGFFANLFSR